MFGKRECNYQYNITLWIFWCFRSDGEYTSDFSCSEDSDSTCEVHVEDEGEGDFEGTSSDSDDDRSEEEMIHESFQVDLSE